ncbi:MAG: large conductance mechanosensitive channel protein MscL [Microbacteriaceae bacterium]
MLKGFKEFILRGNVIDLAVAVVIGAAFTGIVNALVTGLFNPVIALIFDADSLAGVGTVLREKTATSDAIVLQWGVVVSSIIQFVLVAAVVYFALIVPINYLKKKAFRAPAEPSPVEPAPPTELAMLVEIRDLLAKGTHASADHGKHTGE